MLRQSTPLAILVMVTSILISASAVGAEDPVAERRETEQPSANAAIGLQIYADELEQHPFDRLLYGFDRNAVCRTGAACIVDSDCAPPNDVCGLTVDSLTPDVRSTIWDLVCDPATPGGDDCQADFWDFSAFHLTTTGLLESSTTNVPVSLDETCSAAECGFNQPNAVLGREDRDFDRLLHVCEDLTTPCVRATDCPGTRCLYAGFCDDDTTRCTEDSQCSGIGDQRCHEGLVQLNAYEREDRASDVTIWLRAAVRGEGVVGTLGRGESRVCYVGTDRQEVPLLRFAGQDANGWHMKLGDMWTHDPFDCDPNTFNGTCPDACTATCPIRTSPCSNNCGGTSDDFAGQQSNKVVNEGVIKLPSGHMFQALVLRSINEFCAQAAFLGCPNSLIDQPIRTGLYLYLVPWLGTVVRLQTNLLECNVQGTEILGEADIKYGLFPPLSVTVGELTDSSIEIAWDPGLDMRVDGYKVYWDTDSGFDSPYAFNSDTHPGQVAFNGTSATISGLDTGVEYFVMVSTLSDYTNPASNVTTTYESLLPPKRIPNDPPAIPSYPIEVAASTGASCTPTEEVPNVTVNKAPGGCEICWDPVVDPCIDGYRLKGDVNAESPATFTDLVDTDQTCVEFDPAESYFLVVGKSGAPGGPEGPLGHDRD